MAEALLLQIAADILTKLSSGVLQEVGFWWGVGGELEKLRRTVSIVQAVLIDTDQRCIESSQVKEWLSQLRQAVYEAGDLLDDISFDVSQRQAMTGRNIPNKVRLCFSCSNQYLYGVKMAPRIRYIGDRLVEIAANRGFLLLERPVENVVAAAMDREQTHSSVPEIVVGRECDKRIIVEMLLSSNYEENVVVVPIVGIGGLGKTTLAQLVFNDEKVQTCFELMLWVCVCENFDVKLIVEKILESITRERRRNLEMDPLKDLLHEKINGRKYLLVLDDVWSEDCERWSRLRGLLASGARGSRIILTTRLKRVAQMTRPVSLHELQGLSDTESWLLFTQMAFQHGHVPSESHEKIGREIVAKCSGVPLAIRAVGRLLYFKDTLAEWQYFGEKELPKIDQGSGDILPILKLSYDHLPSYLKHCFAYCRLFPKEHIIQVPRLINLWMAQGFIKPLDPSQCLQDVGFEYFMDLLSRSLFQEAAKDEWGNIVTCKMHDLIHDLATQVAGVEIVVSNLEGEFVDGRTRHVSSSFYPYSPWKVPTSMLKATDLRTFLLLNEAQQDLQTFLLLNETQGGFQSRFKLEERQCSVIFSNFRRLRVLDLHNSTIGRVPPSISKLRQLRYLDLSENDHIKILPDSITALLNLQVLRLDKCARLKQLPKDINKLVNLSELGLSRCYSLTHMPPGLGKLTSLYSLSRFVVSKKSSGVKHCSSLSELGSLNNLRGQLLICNLRLVKKARVECSAANLKQKQHLLTLTLDWGRYDDNDKNFVGDDELALEALQPHLNLKGLEVIHFRGLKFASWLSTLTNLVAIAIFHCQNCEQLPPLHQLPYLKRLRIEGLTALEYIDIGEGHKGTSAVSTSTPGQSFFPSLESLHLWDCRNLKGWWKTVPTSLQASSLTTELLRFHLLSHLAIGYCPSLAAMPLFPPLKSLALWDTDTKSLETMLSTMVPVGQATTPFSSASLSQMQYLQIGRIQDLELLPVELLQNLASLKTLVVSDCPRLKNLDQALQHLKSLEELWIWQCEGLTLLGDESMDSEQWQGLRSLRCLFIRNLPNLESLPSWIEHNSTLQELHIWECPNLISAPAWMSKLTALHHLSIYECPHLLLRCGSNTGEDWPKIAHIPNIKVDDRIIQLKGCYQL